MAPRYRAYHGRSHTYSVHVIDMLFPCIELQPYVLHLSIFVLSHWMQCSTASMNRSQLVRWLVVAVLAKDSREGPCLAQVKSLICT